MGSAAPSTQAVVTTTEISQVAGLSTRLGLSAGDDAWRQWVYEWDAPLGDHIIQVRATTADGELQTDERTSAFPNGTSGRHEIHVSIVR